MKTARKKVTHFVIVMIAAGVCFACAEAKIGVGPFKAASVEVGPEGSEVKGPNAGPLKGKSLKLQLKKN